MSTVLESPPEPPATVAQRLRAEVAAMRLSFTWFGVRKSLSPLQKSQAAESFGAVGEFLSAGKKLIDTGHPRFKAVTAIRHQAVAYFQGMSLPYPEPAVRLVRRADLDDVQRRMTGLQSDLAAAAGELEASYHDLRRAARDKLGRLYADGDYPPSLAGEFAMSWEYPSVEPPDYLRRLSPELYQQECQRVAARFDQAVELAEQMFLDQLGQLVTHLAERLSGQADGKPKIFRDSAVENLTEFFQRFARLNIRSSGELEALVERAQDVLTGVGPQQLRDSAALRRQVSQELARVEASLDGLVADRPRRNILRGPR